MPPTDSGKFDFHKLYCNNLFHRKIYLSDYKIAELWTPNWPRRISHRFCLVGNTPTKVQMWVHLKEVLSYSSTYIELFSYDEYRTHTSLPIRQSILELSSCNVLTMCNRIIGFVRYLFWTASPLCMLKRLTLARVKITLNHIENPFNILYWLTINGGTTNPVISKLHTTYIVTHTM